MEIGTHVWIMSLNVEIGVKYGMIFVPSFLICSETHFGVPLRFRKGWVIIHLLFLVKEYTKK